MQLTKFSKFKIIHTPGKNLSVADMLSRSFTKTELQLNQLKHKQLPPQIGFALLQNGTLKPVNYSIKPSRKLSTDTSTLNLSALSSNSALRLVRQPAQQLSSETHSSDLLQSPYFTSGFQTASLLSSNAQTAFLSADLFSQVVIPTPVPAHVRLPEYYTAEHSRPPTPNFADYPLRVDGITIYDPQNDPRFPILAERFINNNDLYLTKEKKQN